MAANGSRDRLSKAITYMVPYTLPKKSQESTRTKERSSKDASETE